MDKNPHLLNAARQLFATGRFAEATRPCSEFLAANPEHVDGLILLATLWQRLDRPDNARECVKRALLVAPFNAALHSLAGDLYADEKNFAEAEACYRRALAADKNFYRAHNALGLALAEMKRGDEAIAAFRAAVECKPDYFYAWNNLGSQLMTRGDLTTAEEYFGKALAANPRYAKALANFASCAALRGDDIEAERRYQRVLDIAPDFPEALYAIGQLQRKRGDYQQAINALQACVRNKPDDPAYLTTLGETLWEIGDAEAAIAAYRAALNVAPTNLKAAIGANLFLPIIYRDRAHVASSRNRFLTGLAQLKDLLPRLSAAAPESIERDISWANFFLAYQGEDDTAAQAAYAGIVRQLLAAAAPNLFVPRRRCTGRNRTRVGFVSNNFYDCTAGRYFQSWTTRLDPARFETFVYHLNKTEDALTTAIESSAATFRRVNALPLFKLANTIAADDLEVLIYPELGMHGMLYALGAFRLAPVQCVGWGHPVTTGHANIDYFLSSDLMEPDDAAQHYSETLVRLPGLGTHYVLPTTENTGTRASFQLPEDKLLYLVPQSLFKIHPDNDAIFLDILEREPRAVLVMFTAERSAILTNLFVTRLQSQFAARGLDTSGRIRILPRANHEEYLRINQLCDVMLDTLHWSGGNTSLDAIAAGLPVVTLPGRFMRGRQTAGMLRAIGCPELIAGNRSEYVELALRLGRDREFRKRLSERILSGRSKIFGMDEPIRALEAFLESVAAPAESSPARAERPSL